MNATNFLKGAVFSSLSLVRAFLLLAMLPIALNAAEVPLVSQGSVWRHHNNGAHPGDGWRTLQFSDETWPSGPAQLGYGDGDEASRTQGAEIFPRPVTAYFRHRFEVADPAVFTRLLLRLLRDDGAVVYLNGTQVARSNMPDGPVTAETLATTAVGGADESAFYNFEIPASALRSGVNLLAVEVHQVNVSSSDLSFDLALIGGTGPVPERPVVSVTATTAETAEPTPTTRVAPGVFTFTRTGDTAQPLPIFVRFDGSATPGADYPPPPERLTFAAGSRTLEYAIVANPDEIQEETERVIVVINQPPTGPDAVPYNIDPARSRAEIAIHNSAPPPPSSIVSIEAVRATTAEPRPDGVISGLFAVRRAGGLDHALNVLLRYAGSATPATDYTPLPDSIVFAPGQTTRLLEVHALSDDLVEGPETVVAEIVLPPDGTGYQIDPNAGRAVVVITGPTPELPVVSIRFVQEPTGEPVPDADYSPGSLEVRRTGSTAEPLQVFYRLAEVGIPELPLATPDVDYTRLPGWIVIPAGHSVAYIRAQAIDDTLAETREMIPVTLINTPPNVDPPHPSEYRINSEMSRASLFIIDNDGEVSPTVRIARPQNGAVYTFGQHIEVRAEVANVQDFLRLEILADGQILETFTSLHAGYWHVWPNPPVGTHVLTAKLYAGGAVVESERVQVLVREAAESAFVHRALPDGYQPGVAFRVELRAEPPDGSRSYAVEDSPPTGWTVSSISHDGVLDPVTRKVKFGPFFDAEDRLLTYMLLPPDNATGHREFDGTGSVDGRASVIAGDRVIREGATVHPADVNGDFALNINETTAYAAAWRAGESWPAGPSPIPLSFVTRAGFLWRNGESYSVAPMIPPPFRWAPSGIRPADHVGEASAFRSAEARLRPGVPSAIQIAATPPAGASAYAIEERIPAGWTVSNISDDGSFDATARVVRWGMFYDAQPRTVAYTITPPAEVAAVGHVSGRLSTDGTIGWVAGQNTLVSFNEENRPRLSEISPRPDGTLRLRMNGPAGQVGVLQFSTDLRAWEDVVTLFMPGGQVEFSAVRGDRPLGYYRMQVR